MLVKRIYMNLKDGVWSHDCDEYFKVKLRSVKEKINYLRESSKFHPDTHKALCDGCEACP